MNPPGPMALARRLMICIALVMPLQAAAAHVSACVHEAPDAAPVDVAEHGDVMPCHEPATDGDPLHAADPASSLPDPLVAESSRCDCDCRDACMAGVGAGIIARIEVALWSTAHPTAWTNTVSMTAVGFHRLPLRPPSKFPI